MSHMHRFVSRVPLLINTSLFFAHIFSYHLSYYFTIDPFVYASKTDDNTAHKKGSERAPILLYNMTCFVLLYSACPEDEAHTVAAVIISICTGEAGIRFTCTSYGFDTVYGVRCIISKKL